MSLIVLCDGSTAGFLPGLFELVEALFSSPPNDAVWGDNADSRSDQFRGFSLSSLSACIGHTLSGNVLFRRIILGITQSVPNWVRLLQKSTGCSNHSDKTEGVRLTGVVNSRNRTPPIRSATQRLKKSTHQRGGSYVSSSIARQMEK